jgi:TonB family protein
LARRLLWLGVNQEDPMTASLRYPVCAIAGLAVFLLALPAAAGESPEETGAASPKLEAPRLLGFVEASYPAEVAPATEPVEVELELVLTADGKVTSATASAATGSPFESAAVAAALQFTFEPAKRDGKPVPARIRYRYVFAPPLPPPPTTGVLEGKVLARTDARLPGTVTIVSQDGTVKRSARTEPDGVFRFDDLPPGVYQIEVGSPDFESYASREEVTAGEATTLTVRLSPPSTPSEPTVAGAPLEFGATATVAAPPREVTKRTLEAEELVRVAGTRGDALRAVELLPGVARPPLGMGFVIIRGSAPTDSAVQMEGASVPRLYHFGGLTSFVQGRLLDRIDLYPGNFSARYGRKVGGIIEVALRDPKSDGFHGMIDVNLIDASALMEGPVTPTLSMVAAFRRSYVDAFLGALVNSTDITLTAAPVYYDYQLMVTWRPSESDRVRAIVYGSADNFKMVLKKPLDDDSSVRGGMAMSTAFHRIQAQWLHHYGERAEQEISLTTGPLSLGQSIGESHHFDMTALEILARAEWRVRLGNRTRLLAGIDSEMIYGDMTYRGPRLPALEGDPNQYAPLAGRESTTLKYKAFISRPAAYAELVVQATAALQLVGGLRADYYEEIERATLDPRLVARYQLRPETTLKAGAGRFSQAPEIAQSLPVIGNPKLVPAHSQHYSFGIEQKLGFMAVSVEGFYKHLTDLVVSSDTPEVPVQNGGKGRIWGGELSLKSRLGARGFGFISYTYSQSRRNDHGRYWRAFDFDQPHILTASGSYRLGYGLELGSTFRYVSGNPYTPVVGSLYDANFDLYRPAYGEVNSSRNPAFHQLDVRIEKVWKRGWGSLAAYLDVQNAYNRRNPEGRYYKYDFSDSRTVPGLFIIPSLGVRGEL